MAREVYFINCMKSVLTKSMLNEGFQCIKELARDYQYSKIRQHILTKLFGSYQRRATFNALSQWRNGNFNLSKQVTMDIIRETNQRNDRHEAWKSKVRTHNALRAEKHILGNLQQNSFQAWKNIARYLRTKREKTALCRAQVEANG